MEKIIFKDDWDEMCPLFVKKEDMYEHVGTGVLLNIWDNTYLLTASHVIDFIHINKNELFMPNNQGVFIKIDGELFYNPLLWNQKREDDKIDFSYFRLSKKMISQIVDVFKPLNDKQISFERNFCTNIDKKYFNLTKKKRASAIRNEIKEHSKNLKSFDENYVTELNNILIKQIITFSGFPLTKTKIQSGYVRSEILYYHGGAVLEEFYVDESLDKNINILASFGRAGAVKDIEFSNFPNPFGISGGGIYKIIRTDNGFDRELIGIGHTYLAKKHLFIGTNLAYCLDVIKNQRLMPYEVLTRLTNMCKILAFENLKNK